MYIRINPIYDRFYSPACRISVEELNHDIEQEKIAVNDPTIYDLMAIDKEHIRDALTQGDRIIDLLIENEALIPDGVTTVEQFNNTDGKHQKPLAVAYIKLSALLQDILHESKYDYSDMEIDR